MFSAKGRHEKNHTLLYHYYTLMPGQGESDEIFRETLPSSKPVSRLRPRLPTTIRSTFLRLAASMTCGSRIGRYVGTES